MKTVIIGAGLSGLSLAYHLEKSGNEDYVILETSSEVGGLCRSIRKKGFTFDLAPHLLHLRSEWTIKFVKELLKDNLIIKGRKAGIFFDGKIIPYPFQYNLYHLGGDIKKECVDAAIVAAKKSKNKIPNNFDEWIRMTFGEGIAKYFMLPYNKKCFCVNPRELTLDFLGRHIPSPSIDEIIRGSKQDLSSLKVGHYYDFYYPKRGGIDYLPKAIAKKVRNINLNEKVIKINPDKKIVFTNKSIYSFTNLVSTIPLKELVKLIDGIPEEVKNANEKLRCNSVCTILLGINRPNISSYHWLYFHQKDILICRISFPMNQSEKMVPQGTSSICAEYAYLGDKNLTDNEIIERTISDLVGVGIIKNREEVIFKDIVNLDYAYVLFDSNRNSNLQIIQDYLRKNNLISIGRFGAWEYSPMEKALIGGKETAFKLISQRV